MASNTWALEAALSLGVEPASEMALGLNMSQENIQLAVGEKALFVVEAIFIDGTKKRRLLKRRNGSLNKRKLLTWKKNK